MNLGNIFVQLSANVKSYVSGMQAAAKSTRMLRLSLLEAGFYAGQTARSLDAVFGRPTKAAIRAGVTEFRKFDEAMRTINTIARLNDKDLGILGNTIMDLAGTTGHDPDSLANALYNIYQSSYKGADALALLKVSAVSAVAGTTDLQKATEGMTAVARAYGLQINQLADLGDVFFRSVERGKVTFQQFTQYMGETVATARTLNIPFNEVGAAIAVITKNGIPASRAFTGLNRLLVQMMRGTEGLNEAVQKMGIEGVKTSTQLIAKKGLAGAMRDLSNYAGDSLTKLVQLQFNIRAQKAAFKLLGDIVNGLNVEMEEVGTKAGRAGAMMRAFREKVRASEFQFRLFRVAVKIAAIELGNMLAPYVVTVLRVGTALLILWRKLTPTTQKLVIGIGLLGTAASVLMGALSGLLFMLAGVVLAATTVAPLLAALVPTLGGIAMVALVVIPSIGGVTAAFSSMKDKVTPLTALLFVLKWQFKLAVFVLSMVADAVFLVATAVAAQTAAWWSLLTLDFKNFGKNVMSAIDPVLDAWEKMDETRAKWIRGEPLDLFGNVTVPDIKELLGGLVDEFKKNFPNTEDVLKNTAATRPANAALVKGSTEEYKALMGSHGIQHRIWQANVQAVIEQRNQTRLLQAIADRQVGFTGAPLTLGI